MLIELHYQNKVINQLVDADYADLKGDAFVCWSDADPRYRLIAKLQLDNQPIIVVGDYVADRGNYCLYYFNAAGEYLNSFCGGGDRRWAWND